MDDKVPPAARFVINHLSGDGDFKPGFRPNSLNRDLGYSDDREILEVVLPASYESEEAGYSDVAVEPR